MMPCIFEFFVNFGQRLNSSTDSEKYAVVHNSRIWYRDPLFEELDSAIDLDVIVTEKNKITEVYGDGMDVPERDVNYIYASNIFGIALSVFWIIIQNQYSGVVIGGWSDGREVIEGIVAIIASKLTRAKFIMWMVYWDTPDESVQRKFAKPLLRVLVRIADATIAPGTRSRDLHIKLGADPEKVFISPNASVIKDQSFPVPANRPSIEFNEDSLTVLYFGRLIPLKGVRTLLRAYKLLEMSYGGEVELLVCGDGPQRQSLQRYADQLDINSVKFTGFVPPQDRHRYYEYADVFVLPSISWKGSAEVWGLVINEAMEYRTPVLTTPAVGGRYDLVFDSFNGYIFSDTEELYQQLLTLLEDDGKRQTMGERGRQIIEDQFLYDDAAKGMLDAIEYAETST
jgi:glycosyltransferase involved in cell wall biosynthesis